MKILKQLSRIIPAVIIGWFAIDYFNIDDFLFKTLFYFGAYIIVGMTLEPLWNKIEKRNNTP